MMKDSVPDMVHGSDKISVFNTEERTKGNKDRARKTHERSGRNLIHTLW